MAINKQKFKSVLIVIVGILFLAVIIGALWYFFLGSKAPSPASTAQSQNFLPFGQSASTTENTPAYAVIGQNQIIPAGSPAPRLTLISKEPVSGFIAYEEGSTTAVRYVLRASGNVYEASLGPTNANPAPTRLTDTTLTKTTNATWISTTSLFLENQIDGGEQYFLGSIAAASSSSPYNQSGLVGTLNGEVLLPNISPAVISPAGDALFYLLPQTLGVEGVKANTTLVKKNVIFSSQLSGWIVSWPTESTITLLTKPSVGVPGYLYFLSTASGNVTKIISGVDGLTALVDQNLKDLLYSTSDGTTISLHYELLSSGTDQTLPFQTLPEKCAFNQVAGETIYCATPDSLPAANYPDVWYQGLLAFSDSFVSYSPVTQTATNVFSPSTLGTSVDAINLSVSPDGKYLFFINRVDESLWALSLQ